MDERITNLLGSLCECNIHFVVTSAKRDSETNKKCGGVSRSAHLFGRAIDIAPYPASNLDAFANKLAELQPDYDQIIVYRTFVHFGVAPDGFASRKIRLNK